VKTSNALMLQMSGKEISLQVLPKLFCVNSLSCRWSGSEFQTAGPWQKMHGSQKCCGKLAGTDRWWHLADRRCWQPSETSTQYSARYRGARWRRQQWTVTANMYCTRWGI